MGFAVQNVVFLVALFIFSSRSLIKGKSLERSNEAWHYVIQLVWVCNDFFKLKHLFLLISSFG